MLHDNLITENFLHHIHKEQSLSPPQHNHNSSTKTNLYNSFHYKQMQHQLIHNQQYHQHHLQQQQQQQQEHQKKFLKKCNNNNNDDVEVLDLSRRCGSVETPPRKSPSPSSPSGTYQTISSIGTIENDRNLVSSPSPVQHIEVSASILAENLQKFYNQQNIIPKPTPNLNSQQHSTIQSLYPIYNSQIKQEPIELNSIIYRQNKELTNAILPSQMPTSPSTINNLFLTATHEQNLLKTESYSASQYKLNNITTTTLISNTSPKSCLKSDLCDIDRLSEVSSIPGSPSSSTTTTPQIIYPKLLNTTVTTPQKTPNSILPNTNSDFVSINKRTRPFKAFPRDPLVIAANFAATDILYDNPRVERYTEYRKRVLEQIRSANGGERTISNPKMRRLNTNNNFNGSNTNISSDGSYSDSQTINSETEDRANDSSSDNDTTVQSTTTNYENNSNININNDNSNLSELKNKDFNGSSKSNNQSNNNNGIIKDAAYYERRRKNNAAAKKSRDRRRIKEDEIAIRAAYLERQNIELLCQLDALKAQLAAYTKVQTS